MSREFYENIKKNIISEFITLSYKKIVNDYSYNWNL
jgi:hypothetical protein